jgi:hypothetical protein
LGLDLFSLGLYVGFENIMGVMLVPKPSKYKSIGVGIDTYEKIVHLAHEERRNISQQLALLVDEEYRMRELRKADLPAKLRKKYVGGLSAVIED